MAVDGHAADVRARGLGGELLERVFDRARRLELFVGRQAVRRRALVLEPRLDEVRRSVADRLGDANVDEDERRGFSHRRARKEAPFVRHRATGA